MPVMDLGPTQQVLTRQAQVLTSQTPTQAPIPDPRAKAAQLVRAMRTCLTRSSWTLTSSRKRKGKVFRSPLQPVAGGSLRSTDACSSALREGACPVMQTLRFQLVNGTARRARRRIPIFTVWDTKCKHAPSVKRLDPKPMLRQPRLQLHQRMQLLQHPAQQQPLPPTQDGCGSAPSASSRMRRILRIALRRCLVVKVRGLVYMSVPAIRRDPQARKLPQARPVRHQSCSKQPHPRRNT